MSRHFPGWVIVDRITTNGESPFVPATGVTSIRRGLIIQRETLTLSLSISVTAANDYGSAKLVDLPASNLILVGGFVDLVTGQSGFTSNVATSLTAAIGTVATTSTTFSNAGEKNVVPTITGVSTGTGTGTLKGATTTTEKLLFLASGAKALYLNVADPVTSGTGTLTVTGTIELAFEDLGAPS